MKNDRPIEVGQVRMMMGTLKAQVSFYFIKSIENTNATIIFLSGDDKGKSFIWSFEYIQEDIVVM